MIDCVGEQIEFSRNVGGIQPDGIVKLHAGFGFQIWIAYFVTLSPFVHAI